MRLDRDETETLLAAASHLSLAELARRADGDHGLLAPWLPSGSSDLPAAAPLPIFATPFLGRAAERAAVSALVCNADVRVVTLTGFAGTGKTTPSPAEAERHQAIVKTLQLAMDGTRFATAWQDGSAMSADEAVAFALERGVESPASVTSPAQC